VRERHIAFASARESGSGQECGRCLAWPCVLDPLQDHDRDLASTLPVIVVEHGVDRGHQPPQRWFSSGLASRALAASLSSLTCTRTAGSSTRFKYQSGCRLVPPFDATMT
jgi:hypothetical protein